MKKWLILILIPLAGCGGTHSATFSKADHEKLIRAELTVVDACTAGGVTPDAVTAADKIISIARSHRDSTSKDPAFGVVTMKVLLADLANTIQGCMPDVATQLDRGRETL